MIDDITAGPEADFMDGIIAAYAPKEETCQVVLSGGETFTFKVVRDVDELDKLKAKAAGFAKTITNKTCPEDWKPYLPISPQRAVQVYVLAELSVEPKISQVGFLKLAKKQCWLFNSIYNELAQKQFVEVQESELEGIEDSKNE